MRQEKKKRKNNKPKITNRKQKTKNKHKQKTKNKKTRKTKEKKSRRTELYYPNSREKTMIYFEITLRQIFELLITIPRFVGKVNWY